jgi:hypothetical protein
MTGHQEKAVVGITFCGKTKTGRTVAIQEDQFTLLGREFWGEPTDCGEVKTIRRKEGRIICWQCAYEQGVVSQTETVRDKIIDSLLMSVPT